MRPTALYRAAIASAAVVLAVLLLGLTFTLGYVANDDSGGVGQPDIQRPVDGSITDGEIDFNTLNEILDILKSEYFDRDRLDDQLLYQAAIDGIIESLADTGTFYIDPTSNQLAIGLSGTFEGIGATVSEQNNRIVIVAPFVGSPAEAAGIASGDTILAVDGEPTDGWSVDKAVLRIRGPKGTEVTLLVRHVDGTEEELTITRDEVRVQSVTTQPPGGVLRDANGNEVTDLGYMRIAEFNQNTPGEVETAARDAEESGKRGLILDLRANPGGLLKETVDTADLFLDEGTILIEVDRDDQETFYQARPGGAALDIPIVILQDQFSASGAEVLAAALQDNARAIIIGTTSFGKGTVNSSRELSDGGALFITIRHWLTPKGVQIDGVGIAPDIAVTPGPLDPEYDPANDLQVLRAIDHLHGLAAGAP
jgi:carboxyl-terminal processing protease